MENGEIPNYSISASSEYDINHAAIQGRLNFLGTQVKSGSWSARRNDVYQWLQIDLGAPDDIVKRVATQGRNYYDMLSPSGNHGQWVTKYTLEYSENCWQFQGYKEGNQNTVKVISDALSSSDKDLVPMAFLSPFTAPVNSSE